MSPDINPDTSGSRVACDHFREALEKIQEIAAREWKADETNYEWYGDIAGIADEVLGRWQLDDA